MAQIVKSVSIEGLCQRRDRLLEGVSQLVATITELDQLGTKEPGLLGGFQDWFLDDRARHDCAMRSNDPVEYARVRIDRSGWLYLMGESGLGTYMDASAREQWRESLYKEVPPLTRDNITATFKRLYEARGEFFDRGVINLFRSLSWNYKTNLPVKFGKRIVMDRMVEWHAQFGFTNTYGDRADQLNDLDRVFHLIDRKPEPDYPDSLQARYQEAVNARRGTEFESEYLRLKWFKKGTLHVAFRRPELVEGLNEIIARHYPDALPPARANR